MLTILGMMSLSVYYIIHLIRSESMTNDQKVLWAVLLFIMNMLVLPIYWYFNIWKEPQAPPTAPAGT